MVKFCEDLSGSSRGTSATGEINCKHVLGFLNFLQYQIMSVAAKIFLPKELAYQFFFRVVIW